MSYGKDRRETVCKACGALNHVLVAYAGDYRANEREIAGCFSCGAPVDQEKCFAIFAAASSAEAEAELGAVQNQT